jgi:hypothetical protein
MGKILDQQITSKTEAFEVAGLAGDEVLETARKYYQGYDEPPCSLDVFGRAVASALYRHLGDILKDPDHYFGELRIEREAEAIEHHDAQQWCKARGATVERVEPPAGWHKGERWVRVVLPDGTSATAVDLAEAVDRLEHHHIWVEYEEETICCRCEVVKAPESEPEPVEV